MVAPRSCPACGGPLAPWRSAAAAEPPWTPMALLRCGRCAGAVTADPSPEGASGGGAHETGAYAPTTPRGSGLAAPLLRHFDRARLRRLGPRPREGAVLLDVGAGRGRFVVTARATGWDARGLEPSARGVDAAAAVYGVTLRRAGIEDAEIAPGSVDAITLWHVLEHLDDPAAALRRVHGWLKPGGVLLVGVPNLASLQARLGGSRWYHLDLPRHRVHLTPAGLATLLADAGFAPGRAQHVALEHNPFGMWVSLVSHATDVPSWLYQALKRNAPLRSRDALVTVAALPLAPPAALLELAAGLVRRGGTIAVLSRRR